MKPALDDPVDEPDRPPPRHILVVDDEAGVRRSIAKMLTRAGYRVTSAESAEEALDVIARSPAAFDLVISDVVMTGMSGVILGDRLRSSGAAVRLMLVSGYPGSHLDDGRLAADRFDLLEKPFTSAQLIDRVRANLSRDPRP
jgi:DNA-binding NtrC family response regulator